MLLKHTQSQGTAAKAPARAHSLRGTQANGAVQMRVSMQVFGAAELAALEAGADQVDGSARAGQLPPSCFHVNCTRAGALKRTKFFFGARCACGPRMPAVACMRRLVCTSSEKGWWA